MKQIISSLILTIMGFYGFSLYLNKELSLYIHPRFFEESLLASIVAILIGVVSLMYFFYKHKSELKVLKELINSRILIIVLLVFLSFIFSSLFIFIAALLVITPNKNLSKFLKNDLLGNSLVVGIILIGVTLPAKSLSSITASQRSIDLNSINLTQSTNTILSNFNKSTSNYSLGDWIALINYNPDPLFYKDKDVKISGFIYKPDNISLLGNEVLIARFIVTCCAVDARPVGLRLSLSQDYEYKQDEWIEVQGKFNINSENQLFIEPTNIIKINQPENPYIF